MKLTRFGCRLVLFGYSSVFSVLGIVVSVIGIIRGIYNIVLGALLRFDSLVMGFYCVTGVAIIILTLPSLNLWILLKIKTSKQDVPGIEKIGKMYSYFSGSLEIMIASVRIMISIIFLTPFRPPLYWTVYGQFHLGWIDFIILSLVELSSPIFIILPTTVIIYSATCLIFTCVKIHGTRVKNNKLLGTYLVFCYALLIFYIIAFIILIVSASRVLDDRNMGGFALSFALLIASIVYLILDISFTVILHSIRVDRENTAGTENLIENI